MLRHRDARACGSQGRRARTLIPVVVGVQHPLHVRRSRLGQNPGDRAGAGIDHQRPAIVYNNVRVTNVCETIQVFAQSSQPWFAHARIVVGAVTLKQSAARTIRRHGSGAFLTT